MRCPNYAGFTTRLGRSQAEPPADDGDSAHPEADSGTSAVPRGGQDLQRGVASWYGPGFHGRATANGERFNMHELTAAHRTLPFGTRVLVHNPRTGKQVVVRINDRGPYVPGRMIDLSKAAAQALGLHARGHDEVVLRQALTDAAPRQTVVASASE